jgi:hypothetical protein
MAAVVTATKRNDLVSICFGLLGYRSSFTNYGKQENNFKNDWFLFGFMVVLDCPIFYAFHTITYLYPAHNNANNVFNGILVGRFYTKKYSFCIPLIFPIAFIGYTVLVTECLIKNE